MLWMVSPQSPWPTSATFWDSQAETETATISFVLTLVLEVKHHWNLGVILRTPTGRLKLADFGCASQVPEHGLFFGRAGSFKSWAPEVHALSSGYNAGYGGKSADIWSGGICSHELICGRYPFRGRKPRETRQGITINQMKNKILAGPDPADRPDPADPDLNGSRFRGILE